MSNLFTDKEGQRGSAIVSIPMHELYKLLHQRLEFDPKFQGDADALCQRLCVEVEKQQGTFPNLDSNDRTRMIVSHATMGQTDGVGQSVNDICVRITALRNEMYQQIPSNVREFLGKMQGVCMGIAMSGKDHPNPDTALMELFQEAQELLFPKEKGKAE